VLKDRHLKLFMAAPDGSRLAAMGWGMAGRAEELAECDGRVRLAGTPYLNNWGGRTSVELRLKDFQVVS
jgi:hypothetical protein